MMHIRSVCPFRTSIRVILVIGPVVLVVGLEAVSMLDQTD